MSTIDQKNFNIQTYHTGQSTETRDDDYDDGTTKDTITLEWLWRREESVEKTDSNGKKYTETITRETDHSQTFSADNKMGVGNVDGFHNLMPFSPNRTANGTYDPHSNESGATLRALMESGPYDIDIFTDAALKRLEELAPLYGFKMETDQKTGRIYFVDTEEELKNINQTEGLFKDFGLDDKQLKRGTDGRSATVTTDDGTATVYDSEKAMSKADFLKLSSSMQDAISWGYNLGYFHEEIFGSDLVKYFMDQAKEQYGEDGTKLAENTKRDLQNAGNSFNASVANTRPMLKTPTVSLAQLLGDVSAATDGKGLRSIDQWVFLIMTLSTNMAVTASTVQTNILQLNQHKEEFQHQKSLVLNKRLFDAISIMNKQVKLANAAGAKKKRNLWQRICDAFKKIFSKDFFQGIRDLFTIVVDLMPITYLIKIVKNVIVLLGIAICRMVFAIGKATGDENLIEKYDTMHEITMSMLESMGDEMILTTTTTDLTKYKEEEGEAEEMERMFNEIGAEEGQYITAADLRTYMKWNDEKVEDTTKGLSAMIMVMAVLSSIMAVASSGGMGMITAVNNMANAADQLDTMDANKHRLNAENRAAQLQKIAKELSVSVDETQFEREAMQTQMEIIAKRIGELMEFVTAIEGDLDEALTTVLHMMEDAAQGARLG